MAATEIEAKLISYTTTLNAYKQEITTETPKDIFAIMDDIKRAEFYNAGRSGLSPEFMLTVADIDYDGELECEVDSKRYAIYRTYKVDKDYIELYCTKKLGVEP